MNVRELRSAFEGLVDDTIDNSILWYWFNEAIEEIASKYSNIKSVEITAESNKWYSLPEDYLQPAVVKDKEGNEYVNYEINEVNEILFYDEGTFVVYYHKVPDTLPQNDDSATPDIPSYLHSCIVYYAASKYYDRESTGDEEESAMAAKLLATFEVMVAKRVKTLRAGRRKNLSFYS